MGIAGLVFKVLRAWAIVGLIPCSGLRNSVDRFNFAAPGVVAALTAVLVMAGARELPVMRVELREGGVFGVLFGYGDGLTHEDRELLALGVSE